MAALVDLAFEAEVIHWRGPSPFFFIAVPPLCAVELRDAAQSVTYGWGMVPVTATIGGHSFTTALFPKDGTYFLPLRDAVRRDAGIALGDRVGVALEVSVPER